MLQKKAVVNWKVRQRKAAGNWKLQRKAAAVSLVRGVQGLAEPQMKQGSSFRQEVKSFVRSMKSCQVRAEPCPDV